MSGIVGYVWNIVSYSEKLNVIFGVGYVGVKYRYLR